MRFELPYPLSVNHYYMKTRKGMILTKKAKEYRIAFWVACAQQKVHSYNTDDVSISIWLYPPDRRLRDIDNPLKCTLDSMQHCNIIRNDSQIKVLHIEMMTKVKGGKMVIEIEKLATVRNSLIVQSKLLQYWQRVNERLVKDEK